MSGPAHPVTKSESVFEHPRSLRRRISKLFLRLKRKKKSRSGLTLVDMAIAIAVASIWMFSVLSVVAQAQELRFRADRIAVAASLAQTKFSQLLSNPYLEPLKDQGEFGDDAGIYRGFSWEVVVTQEKIDLAQAAEKGEISPVDVDDMLPAGIKNEGEEDKEKEGLETVTGAQVEILRIVVKIQYPLGMNNKGEYAVETIRGMAPPSAPTGQ